MNEVRMREAGRGGQGERVAEQREGEEAGKGRLEQADARIASPDTPKGGAPLGDTGGESDCSSKCTDFVFDNICSKYGKQVAGKKV